MIHNLIDKVKLAFQKEKQLPNALYQILGFYPHRLEIYRIALSHKSRAYRGKSGQALNNERLEYLGDAILEAVVSDIVFHRYPSKPEGFLTSTRSKIVQRATLNRLAEKLGLDRLVQRSASTRSHNSYIGGNAFEALVGAIYLDRGYAHCKWFIERRILGRLVDVDGLAHQEVNFKSKLLEWTQKNRIQAEYRSSEPQQADSNSPYFRSTVIIEGINISDGQGYSKKESQQAAARAALTRLRREPQLIDRIFRAKEKRTAMEADEVCDVPRIDEIEEEIRQSRSRTSRHAKSAPGQPDNANRAARQSQEKKPAQQADARQSGNARSRTERRDAAAPAEKAEAARTPQLRLPRQDTPKTEALPRQDTPKTEALPRQDTLKTEALPRQDTPKTEALPRAEKHLSLPRNDKAATQQPDAAAPQTEAAERSRRSRAAAPQDATQDATQNAASQAKAQPDLPQPDAAASTGTAETPQAAHAPADAAPAATPQAEAQTNAEPQTDELNEADNQTENENNAAADAQDTAAAQGKSRRNRSRRGRRKPSDADAEKSAVAAEKPAAAADAAEKPETDSGTTAAQNAPRRKRSRRSDRSNGDKPETPSAADSSAGKVPDFSADAADAGRPARRQRPRQRRDSEDNDEARREEMARREAIISQAEEAAWAEHAD